MARRKISDSATITVADDLLSREMAPELVILNLRDGVYYGLEDVGVRVWSLLQKPVTLATLRDTLVAEYSVDQQACEEDVRALLADLEARGLIVVQEPR
jgi:hypothetical protein